MSQNTRLLLIGMVVMVVFGIFLQSLIARSLQDSFGTDNTNNLPHHPTGFKPSHGIEAIPGASPQLPGAVQVGKDGKDKVKDHKGK